MFETAAARPTRLTSPHGALCRNRTYYPWVTNPVHRQQCLQGIIMESQDGIEPPLTGLQSVALPLGYWDLITELVALIY